MSIDLHLHTTASDGTLSPAQIVGAALERGLSHIAICDHDSVDGVDPALRAADGTALTLIPAVELSVRAGEHDLHMLGFLIDHHSEPLLAALRVLRDGRIARAQAMVDALADAGFAVTIEGVLAHANGGAVGRSHIARALVAAGDVDSVEEAFTRYIGRHGPYFRDKDLTTAEEAITLVHAAGGVAVIAHPGVTRSDGVLDALVAGGLDGIEAYHADHSREQRDRYVAYADSHGLILTGGSDYHGPEAKGGTLGGGGCPEAAVTALMARAELVRAG